MKFVFRLILASVLLSLNGLAQNTTKVLLQQADNLKYNKDLGEDLRRVIGNVIFEHDGALLYCDSAYFYELANSVEAFGDIRIKSSDTLNIYGEKLVYDGNTRIANLTGNVKLVDKQTVLKTEHLIYDRNLNVSYYNSGARITNKENKLTSIIGYYYTSRKEFFFKEQVVLVNPDYTMKCDTLLYNTLSRTSFFKGPTTITGKENNIYCENGWYNTRLDISQFNKNARLVSNERITEGDSLYYDRNLGIGKAFRNVTIRDTIKNVIIKGNKAWYDEKQGFAMMTDSAQSIMTEKNDSLFLHGDTLYAVFDTATQETRDVKAYHGVRFYRTSMQGLCDSLIYKYSDSTLCMYHNPVVWAESNQLTADSIRVWITNNEPDSMMLYNTSFIVSLKDSLQFDQVKGKNMRGFFNDNQLVRVNVLSNAETIYYAKEDDGDMIGINFAAASEMIITLKDKKIERIKYLTSPEATLRPESDVVPMERKLKGFEWLETKRPVSPIDIFRR